MAALYEFLKVLVKFCLWVFFSKSTIINRDRLKFDHAAILISNHPNTLIDPLNVAARSKKQVHFLANASMFSTPFTNWLFTNLYCVPIQRAKDTGAKHVDNKESFDRCDEFLDGGGVLWIAPEGGSEMERRVRPFKTGTARIGFSAENQKNFELDLAIIPVGLSYSDPEEFRSEVVIHVGEAVYPKHFQETYKKAPREAVRELTAVLEEKVRALAIHLEDDTEKHFIPKIELLLKNSQPLGPEAEYFRTKQAIEQLRSLKRKKPEQWQKLHDQTNTYFSTLEQTGLDDEVIVGDQKGRKNNFFTLLAGFPLFIFGWINNLLPAYLPALLAKKMNLYPGYNSTIKILSGLITFPLFYWLTYKLVNHYFTASVSVLYLLAMPVTGFFALWYLKKVNLYFKQRKLNVFRKKQPEVFEKLLAGRRAIWQELSKVLTLTTKI